MRILVLNAGSTNLKLSVLDGESELFATAIEHRSPAEAVSSGIATIRSAGHFPVDAVGHRIVHGGREFTKAVLVTDEVMVRLSALNDLAPLHNPPAHDVLVEARKLLPDLPQVAAFDTAFHASIPPHAFTYPVPAQWTDEWGIRKFGFHGLSHEYCARRATEMMAASGGDARPRVVVAHLGGGCSLSASQEGICSDTTMGFTPLDGLMMATRCGSLDPGAIIYAMRHHGQSVDDIERTLNRESGLLGVSGLSDDFRVVEKAIFSRNAKANLAFNIFAYRVRLGIGAMAAALGGIDALAFTAGIGEHSSELRSHVCREIDFLGVKLDRHANEGLGPDSEIGAADSRVRVFVIHAREDISIVRAVERVLSK